MEKGADNGTYRDLTGHGAWHIGDIRVSDGPHGVRSQEDGAKNNDSYEATCYPTASAAACSWDPALIAQMAAGIAAEAKELGVQVVLGPGVNIKRSPLCGRNFEYYSEDPFLAGKLAAAYIRAMQEAGVGTSLKHFACNNQETHRMTANSMVDERALHEIYLAAFEIAVKEAQPATVMASYNYVNGTPACENRILLTETLREKWGFKGLVMSDWGACVDLPACIAAGMDVEMPDSLGHHADDLAEALRQGHLTKEEADRALERVRALCDRYRGAAGARAEENGSSPARRGTAGHAVRIPRKIREEGHRIARRVEEESAVLLKNDGFFPLAADTQILLIGDLALNPRIQGGGSSHIHTEHVDDLLAELAKCDIRLHFERGYDCRSLRREERLERQALRAVRKAAEKHIPILFCGGLTDRTEGEGYDRTRYDLPRNQAALLKQMLAITGNIGYLSFGGSPYDMTLADKCRGVLQLYLGGEGMGAACARIVTGRVNPSGKLAESIPFGEQDVPSYGFFGRQGEQNDHPDDVEYRESIFVGYRYYDTFDRPVRYCFGHGLSYTTYAYTDLTVTGTPEGGCTVRFSLENTGDVAGSEICQVYVKNPDGEAFRPRRELRGFAKVRLAPGEKKTVEIVLDPRAFCVRQNGEFTVIGGRYEIQAGASLADIRLKQEWDVEGSALISPLTLKNRVPLSDEDFGKIYSGERTHFSQPVPGEFTRRNSLAQMQAHSPLARRFASIGRLLVRLMFLTRPAVDPEVRMMTEGLLEGNIDGVCNQSGGLLNRETMQAIIDSANGRDRNG